MSDDQLIDTSPDDGTLIMVGDEHKETWRRARWTTQLGGAWRDEETGHLFGSRTLDPMNNIWKYWRPL